MSDFIKDIEKTIVETLKKTVPLKAKRMKHSDLEDKSTKVMGFKKWNHKQINPR